MFFPCFQYRGSISGILRKPDPSLFFKQKSTRNDEKFYGNGNEFDPPKTPFYYHPLPRKTHFFIFLSFSNGILIPWFYDTNFLTTPATNKKIIFTTFCRYHFSPKIEKNRTFSFFGPHPDFEMKKLTESSLLSTMPYHKLNVFEKNDFFRATAYYQNLTRPLAQV